MRYPTPTRFDLRCSRSVRRKLNMCCNTNMYPEVALITAISVLG